MLNMLIAIMGDSFDYAQENKDRFSTQTKLDILSTQAPALRQKENFDEEKVFMIIVRPDDAEGDLEDDWHGSINKVVLLANKSNRELGQEIKRSMARMQHDLLSSVKASQTNELTGIKSDIADMKSYIGKLDAKLDKLLARKE